MTSDEPGLFALDPGWVAPAADPAVKETPGARRRARQAQAIAAGLHPLTLIPGVRPIRLRPDARMPTPTKGNAGDRPVRCGTCKWRVPVHGGARSYPKCVVGHPFHDNGAPAYHRAPRVSSGEGTDCASWWPGCVDYEPETGVDAPATHETETR